MHLPDADPGPGTGLDPLLAALGAARDMYTADVTWSAPRRGVTWQGRSRVLRGLLDEAAAMCDAELTMLGRRGSGGRLITEYCVRFVYAGDGIEGLSLAAGDRVELERLRILSMAGRRIAAETCIETWTVLSRA